MASLIEVHAISVPDDPVELWGGFAGQGFDNSLFLGTGARHGGRSRIFRHQDSGGDANWVQELDSPAETINKIRDFNGRLYAFYESPPEGQRWIVRRELGSPDWPFEIVPREGHVVGGRGIGVNYFGPDPFYIGASQDWDGTKRAEVFRQDGGYVLHRAITPSLMWELEFDTLGRLWEFWNAFDGISAATFVDGVQVVNPPGENVSHAAWFPPSGHMYGCGLANGGGSTLVYRSAAGAGWETIFTFPTGQATHVLYVPRAAGELWAVAQAPLQVARSFDGVAWETVNVPVPYDTGLDANHVTAIGFYRGRVWVAARDRSRGVIAVLREPLGAAGRRPMLQII